MAVAASRQTANGNLDQGRVYVFSLAGLVADTNFADFSFTKAGIEFKELPSINDGVKLEGIFTLGATSDGIDPLNENVVITVGNAVVTVPAGSFAPVGTGKFVFQGVINGADVKIRFKEEVPGTYKFDVRAIGIDLTDTANPVDIIILIGLDTGVAKIRLGGRLKS